MKHANIHVRGKVQGVFFREEARKKADELGLVGFVENLEDGSVSTELEGEEALIDEFVEWCHAGPVLADVHELDVQYEDEMKGFVDFTIRT